MAEYKNRTLLDRIFIDKIKQTSISKFEVGRMYLFGYDPKTKNDLPYYDELPLVLVFKITPDGFIGLNLHYLSPGMRLKLLDYLFKYKIITNGQIQKLALTYNRIVQESHGMYKPCIKRYLLSHVRSQFILMDIDDWFRLDRNGHLYNTIITLPIDRFKKLSKEQVWVESDKIIRGK